VQAIALDLDAVLADTRPLWRDWLEDVARRAHVELEVPVTYTEAALGAPTFGAGPGSASRCPAA